MEFILIKFDSILNCFKFLKIIFEIFPKIWFEFLEINLKFIFLLFYLLFFDISWSLQRFQFENLLKFNYFEKFPL